MGKRVGKKQKWCHVICAQYVSETWFDENSLNLNNVCNITGIRERRYKGECEYCHRSKGAKVKSASIIFNISMMNVYITLHRYFVVL